MDMNGFDWMTQDKICVSWWFVPCCEVLFDLR